MRLSLYSLVWMWLSVQAVYAALSKRMIDDELGDLVTKDLPVYAPDSVWFLNSICPSSDCTLPIDTSLAMSSTYHGGVVIPNATDHPSIYFTFTGVNLSIYAITPRYRVFEALEATNVSVYIDSVFVDRIVFAVHDEDDIMYNNLVFESGTLPNTEHNVTMILELWEQTVHPSPSSFLFDYAIYTFDDTPSTSTTSTSTSSSPSSSTSQHSKSTVPVAAITGGTVGGVFAIVAAFLVLFCLRHRARRGLDTIRRTRAADGDTIDGPVGVKVDPFPPQPEPEMTTVTSIPSLPPMSTSPPQTRPSSPQIRLAFGRTLSEFGTTTSSVVSADPIDTSSTRASQYPADMRSSSQPSSSSGPMRTTVLGLATNDGPSASLARARSQKAAVRQQELAQQMKEMERAVSDLKAGHAEDAREVEEEHPDDAIRRQMEALQLEIEKLKLEQEEQRRLAASAMESPPAYEHDRM